MKKRPNKSSLKTTYLQTYNSIEACLMQYNFSLLFSRRMENQVFDMIITAQNEKIPARKLECNKDLNVFCKNLINEYNYSISFTQKILDGTFSCFLLFAFFNLLDLIFDKGVMVSTLMICSFVSIGYLTSNSILKHIKNVTNTIRIILVLAIVLIPFILITLLKINFKFMFILLPFIPSLLLTLFFCGITAISYYIVSKKYDLFIFTKNR